MERNLEPKQHYLIDYDFGKADDWFMENCSNEVCNSFRLSYMQAMEYIKTYPFRSHSLSTFHFFDKILNDDYFRYFKLGKNTSYCLFNYPKGKNYILACMSLNLNNLASSLQTREQTKNTI